jgi:Rieske Fe-S protein
MSTSTPTPFPEATLPETAQSPAVPTCCGRRSVLRAAGLVALSGGAVALAACSADSPTTTPSAGATSATPSTAESSAAASPSAAASESPSEQATSEAAPEGSAVAISEVAVGGGVVVDEKYVVTQPTDGEFKAFSAICTHQGCTVGGVEDGAIVCPCHNSHFDISTGNPVSGPAQEPLSSAELTTSGDNIYVTG